jgi:tripartite-type tricarboxylate transporter receptor subunit TctC
MMNRRSNWISLAFAGALAVGAASHAEKPAGSDYPQRPIRLLVPSPPGGPSDFAARLVAPRLSEALGQNVVVDTRQSVNGVIATEIAAKSAPDGLTLAIGNNGTHVINASLYRKLPYDPLRDFAPVTQMISAASVLVGSPKFAPRTFQDLVAAAKKDPGKYNIGVAGAQGQITTAVLKFASGMKLNDIPYKGSAPTEFAVMSHEVELAFLSVPVVTPHVRSGRMKAYGVSTAKRVPLIPDVPTIAEAGIPGFEFGNWHGLFAPRATPDAIVRRLHKEVAHIFQDADLRKLVIARGSDIIVNTPEEFGARLKRDVERFRKIIADAGIPQL